jgi:1,4-dihydroxy-2-naphthoyl-CoA hydrolase
MGLVFCKNNEKLENYCGNNSIIGNNPDIFISFLFYDLPFISYFYIFKHKSMTFDKQKILAYCNEFAATTLMGTLHIEYVDAGEDFLVATMPVNPSVHQPMGLLHGGATVALAESVGSAASMLFVNSDLFEVRGIEIAANHLKSKRNGIVTATAKIIHKGKSIHLWEIRIVDENDNLISICKLTNMVLPKRKTE